MAKLDPQQNVYYPSKQKTGPLHDDFRILFNHVYEMRHELEKAHSRIGELEGAHRQLAANGPSNTKIAGLYVQGVVPKDGQKLTYSSKSGQIEWQ